MSAFAKCPTYLYLFTEIGARRFRIL